MQSIRGGEEEPKACIADVTATTSLHVNILCEMGILVSAALGLLLLSQVFLQSEGSCYFIAPETGTTQCRTSKGRNLRPGQTYMDNCFRCGCQQDGVIRCCGTGRYAGAIGPPSHCRVLPVGKCGYRVVMRDRPTIPCS